MASDTEGKWTLIRARGEIDLSNAESINDEVARHLNGGANRIAVDLREVTFMDSSGLRALLIAKDATEEADGELLVLVEGGPVDYLLEVTGIGKVLTVSAQLPSTG